MAASGDRLDSWKEIASYLNRSVRTVRRWEREEGLPVHRQLHRTLGSVYANKTEIDAWRETMSDIAPAPRASIAVLPFENLSADPENEYFADGLTDEVTTNLSKVRALRVISRTSARVFRNTTRSAKEIAADLGVRYLVEGSVRRAGTRLRIGAQLIDAATDGQVWGDTYDGTVDDVFAIQERLARVIVDALELRLSADEERQLTTRPIDNVPTYECYLRARYEGFRWRKDAIDHAVDLLRNALDIIGDNARLYAALGLVHLQYREAGIDLSEQPLLEAEKCAERLFALEPDSAPAFQLRGWIHYSRGEIQDAVRDLKASLRRESNNADTLLLLTNCYLISGQVAAARPLIARALTIDPLTPVTRCMPAFADILEGDFASAIEPYRQMFEMDPSNPMARLFYMWVLFLNERDDEARALAGSFAPEVEQSVPARIAAFFAEQRVPQIDAAATATDLFPRFLAQGYAAAGNGDEAIRWLEIAIDRGFINYPFLARHDPFFKALRNTRRFNEILDMARERWERFEA